MVNIILYISSCIFIVPVSIYEFYNYSNIHSYMSLITALTSILNHGYTYKSLKIIDRSMVFTMCLININMNQINIYLLPVGIIFYICSKNTKNNIYHILLHIIGSLSNYLVFNKIN